MFILSIFFGETFAIDHDIAFFSMIDLNLYLVFSLINLESFNNG